MLLEKLGTILGGTIQQEEFKNQVLQILGITNKSHYFKITETKDSFKDKNKNIEVGAFFDRDEKIEK